MQKIIRHYLALDYYPEDSEKKYFEFDPGHVYPTHIGTP